MQGDERLRACPFCGEEPALMSGGQGWAVACMADDDVCDTSPGTWAKPTQAEAIAAWNRRAPAATPQADMVLVPREPTPEMIAAYTALGYAIAPHLIDAADHGVPQHRERLFIALTRTKHPVELRLPMREHVPAARIVDFDGGTWSPIHKPGRAPATLVRIDAGRRQHGDRFLTAYYGNERGGRSLSRPVGTITTRDRWAVVDGDRMRMLSVAEARAAMGFRASYRLPERAKDAMHMLGNAVVPAVARDVILALKEAA